MPEGSTSSLKGIVSALGHNDDDLRWGAPLITALILGLVVLVLFGVSQQNQLEAIAAGILAGGAAFAVGAILGFLFGIPRVISDANRERSSLDGAASYQVNTNLEQISDWLTKIIIGVGLVEIKDLAAYFGRISTGVASAFGADISPAIASIALIYFGINGFLLCYLWTRLLLLQVFCRADLAARQSPEFYEGLIHALLYQPPPDGFTAALRAADEFKKRFGEGNWRLWRSITCANAQESLFLRESDPDAAKKARDEALSALRRTLKINPSAKQSMKSLWDPELVSPQEDDLVVFAKDPDFIAEFSDPPK